MPNATKLADAQASPETERAERAEIEASVAAMTAFDKAEARYLRARAAIKDPVQSGVHYGEDDEIMQKLDDESRTAKRALFLVRAHDVSHLWTKLELFEHDVHEEISVGATNHGELMLELASIKTDIFALCE